MTTSSVDTSTVFKVREDLAFSTEFLRKSLKDVPTALFFAKVYSLPADHLAALLRFLFPGKQVIQELTDGNHSTELQSDPDLYEDEDLDYGELMHDTTYSELVKDEHKLLAKIPDSEVLAQLWAVQEVVIAASIAKVATGLGKVMGRLPTNEGHMVFNQMAKLNQRRGTIGDYRANITRRDDERQREVLVILDDSGSMSPETIRTIVGDVVALSYAANATLAQVSSTCRVHAPGTFDVDDVLEVAEYRGTCYDTLAPLFDRDWDEVITVADYDSYGSAKSALARCKGRIGVVTDVSLVGRSTFLSECVGQLADVVRPALIANRSLV